MTTATPSEVPQVRHGRRSYRVLRVWARSAVRVVYRRVEVDGREHVPATGPVIFAANHSNALADVAVIVAKLPAFPHFLAATSWWKHRSARMLFQLGGVLPVRRKGDPAGPSDNNQTFDACYNALASDAAIAIFPEGVMHADPGLLPLKNGAARIGLGAAEFGVRGVLIVPVGLVYEDRGRFRSDAEVRFGKPIAMDDWCAQYTVDARQTVRDLTAQLSEELLRVVTEARPRRENLDERSRARVRRELALLAPAAAVGAIAQLPVLLTGVLANAIRDDMWRASAKGVAGTLLLPLTCGTELALLSRRYGFRRGSMLTALGTASGIATVTWIDRRSDLKRAPQDR